MTDVREIGHDAKAIANRFLDLADQETIPLNLMHLQKLLYNAHGYHLAMLGEPLFWQTVYAWKYGPVIADVYHEFNDRTLDPIESRAVYFDKEMRGRNAAPRKSFSRHADFDSTCMEWA